MSIKKLNESIDNLLNEVEVSKVEIKPTFEEELRKSLKETLDYCIRNDRSLYGIADSFADRIESMVPDRRWWEVTDCDFYTEMFNTGDFNSVINCIIDELKPEYKQNVNESYNPEPDEVTDFKKAVNSADTIDDIQFLIYELSDGVAEDACQVAFDTATNSDENDIDTIKDEVISAIDMYLEDNEFNEAYQKGATPKHKDVIESARDYGGTYDIDPSQYFIKADTNGFAEDVVDAINARSYPRVKLVNTYLENNKIKVTVEWDGNEVTASEKIDMRKIHKPNDIDKYSKPIADELIRQLKKFGFYVGTQLHNEDYLNGSYNPKNKESISKRLQEEDAEETQYIVGDGETGSIYNSYDDAKRAYDHLKSHGFDAVMEPVEDISLQEDTIKTKDDKWVNKGTEGTHGKFRTKKQADAQRKAMFANGFKGENYQTKLKFEAIRPDSDLVKYQQWVDYDMKHDGKISSETKRLLRKVGLQVVKDEYGDYKVIHTVSDIRGILSQHPDVSIYTKDELGSDYRYHTLIKSRDEALKYNYQPDFWGTADEYQKDNVKFVSELAPYIGKQVLAFDDDTVFTLKGVLIDNQYNSLDHTKVLVEEVGKNKFTESVDTSENKESVNKNTLSEEYDEPELLGKGYAAPTSMDYVSNIKRLVKNKVTDFTDIQNLMQKTMNDIDAFDNYWKVHKAAIMKNIKEAQDLIPTEYRI